MQDIIVLHVSVVKLGRKAVRVGCVVLFAAMLLYSSVFLFLFSSLIFSIMAFLVWHL